MLLYLVSVILFYARQLIAGWVFFILPSIILVFVYVFIRAELRKLEKIVNAAKEKDFSGKYQYSGSVVFDRLGIAVNELIEYIGKLTEIRRLREREFITILNAIEMPVFIVDNKGRLMVHNKASKPLMRISQGEPSSRFYYETFRYDNIISFIREAITMDDQKEKRLEVENQIFETLSFPFVSRSERFNLFMLGDITALERVARMEREFIASVSHELRTPLSVVKGTVEIIENEKLIKKNGEKFITSIKDSSERMENLVKDLSKFTELESWKKPLEKEINLSITAKNICDSLRKDAEEKNLELKLNEGEEVFIRGDLFLIEELIRNLVNNSIRYTDNGHIEFSVYRNKFAIIEVKDTGVGIPDSDIPHLFEPFFRVDSSRSRAGGGSGLGLAISKRIVRLHKGNILVESKIGSGTKFVIQFPLLRKINKELTES
jgi:two-component system phosphate regulon sensor histidine kinase PhoR